MMFDLETFTPKDYSIIHSEIRNVYGLYKSGVVEHLVFSTDTPNAITIKSGAYIYNGKYIKHLDDWTVNYPPFMSSYIYALVPRINESVDNTYTGTPGNADYQNINNQFSWQFERVIGNNYPEETVGLLEPNFANTAWGFRDTQYTYGRVHNIISTRTTDDVAQNFTLANYSRFKFYRWVGAQINDYVEGFGNYSYGNICLVNKSLAELNMFAADMAIGYHDDQIPFSANVFGHITINGQLYPFDNSFTYFDGTTSLNNLKFRLGVVFNGSFLTYVDNYDVDDPATFMIDKLWLSAKPMFINERP